MKKADTMKFLISAALATALLSIPATAPAQTRGELEKRLYNEKGEPIVESKSEVCQRRYEKEYGACISHALQSSDLNRADRSYYQICSRRLLPSYRKCLGQPGAPPPPAK